MMGPEELWTNVAKRLLEVFLGLFLQGWTGPRESQGVGMIPLCQKDPVECRVDGHGGQEMPHSWLDGQGQGPRERCRKR